MRTNARGNLWRLGAFVALCSAGMLVLVMVFGQLRFQKEVLYGADFTNVSGLRDGNFVRIAGVEVGKVKKITLQPDTTVHVQFSTDDTVILTKGTKAVIRYEDLVGGRFLELQEGSGPASSTPMAAGQTIPADLTAPALDLDALIGGFRPLFRALNPDQINALSGQLINALQGQGNAIGSVLTQVSQLTSKLADRDDVIGSVITNLSTVLGSIGNQSKQLDKAIDSVAQVIGALSERRTDITNALAYTDAAASSVADLLHRARPAVKDTVHQLDRTTGLLLADHDYLDNLLATLPDTYRKLGRQGIYGDFYSFYTCDILLKVNGKGGQPVYIQVTRQPSGRCTPR